MSCEKCIFADYETMPRPGPEQIQLGCQLDVLPKWVEKNGGQLPLEVSEDLLTYCVLPAPCPYHRDEEWGEKQHDISESLNEETQLRFSTIVVLDEKYNVEKFIKNVKKIDENNSLINIQIIDMGGRLFQKHKEAFSGLLSPYNIYCRLDNMDVRSVINQMVKRVKTTYYYCSDNGKVDNTIIEMANNSLFEELSPALTIRSKNPKTYLCQTLAHNMVGGNSDQWVYDKIFKQIEEEDKIMWSHPLKTEEEPCS